MIRRKNACLVLVVVLIAPFLGCRNTRNICIPYGKYVCNTDENVPIAFVASVDTVYKVELLRDTKFACWGSDEMIYSLESSGDSIRIWEFNTQNKNIDPLLDTVVPNLGFISSIAPGRRGSLFISFCTDFENQLRLNLLEIDTETKQVKTDYQNVNYDMPCLLNTISPQSFGLDRLVSFWEYVHDSDGWRIDANTYLWDTEGNQIIDTIRHASHFAFNPIPSSEMYCYYDMNRGIIISMGDELEQRVLRQITKTRFIMFEMFWYPDGERILIRVFKRRSLHNKAVEYCYDLKEEKLLKLRRKWRIGFYGFGIQHWTRVTQRPGTS